MLLLFSTCPQEVSDAAEHEGRRLARRRAVGDTGFGEKADDCAEEA